MKKDYSLYTYYKGSEDYPNDKAAFFGFYEMAFENAYEGKPEDKEEAFKTHMASILYEQCSERCYFGMPSVDKDKCLQEYFADYFNPERNLRRYERGK